MKHTFTFGLIGWPLEHSLSPFLHQSALQTLKLDGTYNLFPISPGENAKLKQIINHMRERKLDGLNVTIPYKREIIPWLDWLTPTARTIGAVNTIYSQKGQLVGENTDAPGFHNDLTAFLDRDSIRISPQGNPHALILGAGGAARAVAYALMRHGWFITLAARRLGQARELVAGLLSSDINGGVKNQAPCLSAISLQARALAPLVETLSLIVNATPLGMGRYTDQSPWPAKAPFPDQAALYDLVYNPVETVLMQSARASGLVATNGRGMLVEQAALAFEIWTGQTAPRQAMHAAIQATRGGKIG